jgi:hypothetical protein
MFQVAITALLDWMSKKSNRRASGGPMQDQLASNQELIEAFRASSGKPDKPFTALDLLLLTCAGNLGYPFQKSVVIGDSRFFRIASFYWTDGELSAHVVVQCYIENG